jgi:hypothetical protein
LTSAVESLEAPTWVELAEAIGRIGKFGERLLSMLGDG